MEKPTKKELTASYKKNPPAGGVYAIHNEKNGKVYLDAAPDLHGAQNRFVFSQKSGCTLRKLAKDWNIFGPDAFRFEILEELPRKEGETPAEYKEELALLKELWEEKFQKEQLY